jgi:hypothetical protein
VSTPGTQRGAQVQAGRVFGGVWALALCTALTVPLYSAPASAQYYGLDYGLWHRPKHRPLEHARKDAGKVSQDPFGNIPKGPLQIFVSIDQQKLHLYADGMHVADTSVATGVPSLPTPLGVFSVIQKQVFHRSNIYSNAPMPFMQRITWSGVALHEGESIGHRASHGCIRMPHDFAVRLYHLTKLGVPVIVSQQELKPAEFADPHLLVHRDKAPEPAPAAAPAVSDATPAATASPATLGLRVGTDTPAAAPTAVADAAKSDTPVSDASLSAAAPPKPAIEPNTVASPDAKSDQPMPASATVPDPPAPTAATLDPTVPMPPAEPADLIKTAPASKAPIAIFVSRKEKKIYVRQDFAPLFQAPVTITDPDKPLGTHVFTALGFAGDDHTTLRWDVVSLPAEPPPQPKRKAERETRYDRYARDRRDRELSEKPADPSPPETPAEVLARIGIPPAAIDYISALIVPGSSLIVSDHGLGEETGEGTNFIVVMR